MDILVVVDVVVDVVIVFVVDVVVVIFYHLRSRCFFF